MNNRCPTCDGPLCLLTSMNLKICYDCRTEWNWSLDEGQLPLVANNRLKNKLHLNELTAHHGKGGNNDN